MTGLDLPWNHRHPEPWDDPGPGDWQPGDHIPVEAAP